MLHFYEKYSTSNVPAILSHQVMSDLERAESSRSPRHQWHAEKVQCRQAEQSRTTAKPSYFLRLNLFSFILLMSLGWESGGCVKEQGRSIVKAQ